MRNVKVVFWVALISFPLFFGIYCGVWIFFIGGIVDLIGQCNASPVDPWTVAMGIAKVFFFELPIFLGFAISAALGITRV